MKAEITKHEAERIAELRSLDILDTEAEPEFDRLTELAAKLCGTPIALISLVDSERQWFKSRVGLDAKETHRDLAFCAHTIHGREALIVFDATKDPRFSDNPLVCGRLHTRFYAGIPLVTSAGNALGTLCVMDTSPRSIEPLVIEILSALAREITLRIELRRYTRNLRNSYAHAIQSERQLQNLLDATSMLIWTSGADKLCNYFNETWLTFRGRSHDQEIGDGWTEGVHPDDIERLLQSYHSAFDRREEFVIEYRLRRHDGVYRLIRDIGRPWNADGGEFKGYVGCCEDVQEQRETQAQLNFSNERFNLAVDGSSDGIWDWSDVSTNREWWSPRFYELLGYKNEEIPATFDTFKDLLHPEDQSRTMKAVQASFDYNDAFDIEYRLRTKSGVYRWFHGRAKIYRDAAGKAVRMAGSITDITTRKRVEAELHATASEAQRAAQSQARFLANMSHEIRTPLTAILGYAEVAQSEATSPDECAAALATISSNGQHLLGLINDILDLSKIEANALAVELQEVTIFEALREVQRLLKGKADDKGLLLEFNYAWPLPARVRTDSLRLKQVLINLIGNAIKFTNTGRVDLTVGYDSKNKNLTFRVRDTGIGLTPEQQQGLFKPFSQADVSTSRKFGGTGLGLTISKQLVELLGGSVSVTSTIGQGSEFHVLLPVGNCSSTELLLAEPQPAPETQPLPPSAPVQLRGEVLVAEDVVANRRLLEMMLKKTGVSLTFVENGRQAVEATENKHFDLILMDMHMPELDGYAATAQIRAKNATVPIIAITADALKDDVARCHEAGCCAHLEKPFNRKKIVSTLQEYLGKPAV